MATTAKGIYYPTSTDAITPLESVFSTVASSVDEAVPLSGTQDVVFTGTTAGSTQTATITFPETLSAAPALIQVTVRGPVSSSGSYVPTVITSSTTDFSVILYRLTSGSSQTVKVVWSVMS
jgi:hypothetical protein